MKKLLMATLLISGFAHGAGLTQISLPPKTFGERMGELQALRSARSGIRTEAVIQDGEVSALLFQAAGSLPGSNGTFFKSDVSLFNFRDTQKLAIYWLPAGQNNVSVLPQYLMLPSFSDDALDDFVAQTLHESGLGAVAIFGVDANNAIDPGAKFDGYSRIWTPEPGGTGGTNSLQLPGVNLMDLVGTNNSDPTADHHAYAIGMRQDADYHCNIGIDNLDFIAHTWTLQVGGANGSVTFTVTVQPFSVSQVAIPPGDLGGDLLVAFSSTDSGQFVWSAYAVTDDNRTGDGWVSHAHF